MFAAGALLTAGLAALLRAGLIAVLEPRGHGLDRWRRRWFHPEREMGSFLEALLLLSFLLAFSRSYELAWWITAALFPVWAMHLPVDLWTWARLRLRPQGTLELHQRGFLLLDVGPLWLRAVVGALAAALYFLVPPIRFALGTGMGFMVSRLQQWLN
ncbi:MAG: hypothetical protein ACRD35_01605 [Candidatus Acidiferrales bacterium]